jgi:hypothetical protein
MSNSPLANEPIESDSEITLRCNRCGTPITPETAILTPTGYRCKDCIRSQQKVFDTAKAYDIPVAFMISAVLAFLGSWLTTVIGFFTVLLAPAAGMLIAEAVRAAVKKRRSKSLSRSVLWGVIIGGSILLLVRLFVIFMNLLGGAFNLISLLPLVWLVVFVAMCASSAYYRFSGIHLK